jgi:hypothetical protein
MKYWYVMALFNNGRSVEFKAENVSQAPGCIQLFDVWEPRRSAKVIIPMDNLLYADIQQKER